MTPQQVLDIKFACDDLGAEVTIREWLIALVRTLWLEGEGFSGKRPFGNSGWQWAPAAALITHGAIKGKLDVDGYVETLNDDELNETMLAAIAALSREDTP